MEVIRESDCKAMWDRERFDWAFKSVEGCSGGILSTWNLEVFEVSNLWYINGALVFKGMWRLDRSECCIVNIYVPCMLRAY